MTTTHKRVLLALAAIAAVIAFFALDLHQWLTFAELKAQQGRLAALHEHHNAPFIAAFFGLYVLVAALSLPGAAILTLAAGAVLGFGPGLVTVSFASSIGATLSFAASRLLFREAVQARFGERLASVQQGMERDGAWYLFTLRLIPVFPFFVVNLVMGVTRVRVWTFYWVSQVGMLAGTAVYVNAGTQLATLDSPAGILSPGLIASFVLLGLFPLLARTAVRWIRGPNPPTAPGEPG